MNDTSTSSLFDDMETGESPPLPVLLLYLASRV